MHKQLLSIVMGIILLGLAPVLHAQVTLGGVVVPKDKIFVFIFIGHSNMVGFGNQEDTLPHARAWDYQIADSLGRPVTHHWEQAKDPIHSDGYFRDIRHSGCGMPFLKRLVIDYPDCYFGIAANPETGVLVKGKPGAEYCKGSALYAEIISVANEIKNNVTLAGIVSQFGLVEACYPDTSAVVRNLQADLKQLALDLRTDLGMPDLPFLIGEYPMDLPSIASFPSSPQVHNQINALPNVLRRSAVIPHDGLGITFISDGVHYSTPGHFIWSNKAVDIFQDSLWLPPPPKVASPVLSSIAQYGTFIDSLVISISTTTPDALIYYTLNNTDPTQSSTLYSRPIVLKQSDTVKVRAFKTGILQSDIVTASFVKIQKLPPPWLHHDIGATSRSGDASSIGDKAFTIYASGSDIAGSADAFHFVYQTISGNFDIVGRIKSLQNTHLQAKSGVMIRENLEDNSCSVMMGMTPTKGAVFVRRKATSGNTVLKQDSSTGVTIPRYVRLTRTANVFTASHSANGTTWTTIGIDTIVMSSTVYTGLALTGHDNSRLCTATTDSVKLSGGSIISTGNAYTFLTPVRRSTYHIGDTIPIKWTTLNPAPQEAVIEFSPNNGRNWKILTAGTMVSTDPHWQNFPWIVPDSISTFALSGKTVRLMLHDYLNNNIVVSDSFFIVASTGISTARGNKSNGKMTLRTYHDRNVVLLRRNTSAPHLQVTLYASSGKIVAQGLSAGELLLSLPRNKISSGFYFLRLQPMDPLSGEVARTHSVFLP